MKSGRFGTYVTDGEYNATLRQGDDESTLTIERASELLEERRAKGPAKKAAKKGAKKTTAKKTRQEGHRQEDHGQEDGGEEDRHQVDEGRGSEVLTPGRRLTR